jgi:hypothetical protein
MKPSIRSIVPPRWLALGVASLLCGFLQLAHGANPEPAGWFAGDIHVHRSCGGSPETVASIYNTMLSSNLNVISLLADCGNGEVQDPTTDLPLVNGSDASISTTNRLLHWDTEWHWDATYTQYPHQALGGHIVALGLSSAAQIWDEMTSTIFNWAHQRGGIAGFAHFQYLDDGIPSSLSCCTPIEYPVEVALGTCDFISEDVNGSDYFIHAYYRLLNCGFRPGFAAGSDHPCSANVGAMLTYSQVAGGVFTYRNWLQGIATGRTVVCRTGRNQFLNLKVNGTSTPGDEIKLTGAGSVTVTVQWTANQSLSGKTIELVQNGLVVASMTASASPSSSPTLSTNVAFTKSGWLCARTMGANGHELHTAAVFVTVNGAPVRTSASDAQFYVQWMDTLLQNTSVGGVWASFFPTERAAAQARFSSAKSVYQQIVVDAGGTTLPAAVPLGNPVDGGSTDNIYSGGAWINAVRFQAASNATVTSISAKVVGVTGRYKCAIYSDSGGQPSRLLRSSAETTNAPSGWQSFPLTASQAVTNGSYYWLAVWSDSSGAQVYYSDSSATLRWGQYNYGNWPDPISTSGGGTYKYCIYATGAAAPLVSIAVAPASATITTGGTQQFTATGNYADSTTQNLTSQATWISSNTPVATVNAAGLATGVAAGAAAISASFNGKSGSATLTVQPPPTLTSITVTPANASLPTGSNQQYTATGTYSDNSTQNLTSQAAWTSSTPGVATINTTGLAAGVGGGTTTIGASVAGVSNSTTLTVLAPPLSVTTASLPGGAVNSSYSGTLSATGGTPPYSWAITNGSLPAGLSLNSNNGQIGGIPTAAGTNSFTVRVSDAGSPGQTATRAMSVVIVPTLVSLAVTPANASLTNGSTRQFTATGTYSDSSTRNLTSQAAWTSSATAVATINASGLATGVGPGTTTIAAALGSVSNSTPLTVLAPSLSVTTASLQGGTVNSSYTTTLSATGGTPSYTWAITIGSLPAGLTLNTASGVISGTPTTSGTNNFTVQVTDAGSPAQTVTRALSIVIVPKLVSLAVTPANASVTNGLTLQYTATGTYSDSSTQNLTSQAAWTSSNLGIATINASGLATGVGPGTTTIAAAAGGVSNSTSLTVLGSGASVPPGIIGNTNNGTTADTMYAGGAWINTSRFQAASNLTVSLIVAKVGAISGRYKCAIYTDSGALPSRLLASSAELLGAGTGWQAFALPSSLVLTNGQFYWLAIWSDDPNGLSYYSSSSGTARWGQYNYGAWPDPFNTSGGASYNYCIYATGTAPLGVPVSVTAVSPAAAASGVALSAVVSATFSTPLNAATLSSSTFLLRDPAGTIVSAALSYSSASRMATLTPGGTLRPGTPYTATVKGGTNGVADTGGNRMSGDYSWTFTTDPYGGGQGGPILVLTNAANPLTGYYGEILLAEGMNEFSLKDTSTISSTTLSQYDVVILGQASLSAAQVTTLTNWVNAGGKLIAMRPDKQLASLLGLGDLGTTLAEGYLLVDTNSAPGGGIVGQPMQYHSIADRYRLAGAASVATLYSSATAPTTNPAVTLCSVGANGGQAAAFTYDLARSIVYTRQGNPAWSGQERDGFAPIRPDDLFFGGTGATDWVNLNNAAIPQADEQQRLLANLIVRMEANKQLLPRFWYFPNMRQAVVVMTGDDHAFGSAYAVRRFNQFLAASPAGGSLANWDLPRCTMYTYSPNPGLTDAQVASFQANGFEISLHLNTGCTNYTPAQLTAFFTDQIAQLKSTYPSVIAPTTHRIHCIAWSGYTFPADISRQMGIRFETSYYYWPTNWVADRPGFMTGSGMPMRFAATNGVILDIYQAATEMTDESGQTYPNTIDTLLNRALGPEGYYGAFVANIHTDSDSEPAADAILASAQSHGVALVGSRQMLAWVDARNSSMIKSISWNNSTQSFAIDAPSNAVGLRVMVPVPGTMSVGGATFNGGNISYTVNTLKGIRYAIVPAQTGNYSITFTGAAMAILPTNLDVMFSGGQLTLSWPSDHTGWILQSQTNALSAGLTGVWYDVAGSTATNQMTFPLDMSNPTVFYRLKLP